MERKADIRFDGWTLKTSSGELVRDGVRKRLQSQPLAILEELLAHPGEVVTREQLVARLWPRGVVDFDTALNSAVRRLRTALGDHADDARYIETIPKRGYRFVGQLEQPPSPSPQASVAPAAQALEPTRPRPRQVAIAVVLLALAVSLLLGMATRLGGGGDTPAAVAAAATHPSSLIAPETYSRYQLARSLLQRRADGDVTRSLAHFGRVVKSAPQFAAGWAGLASAYLLETMEGRLAAEQGLPQARAAAERALELDPDLVEARLRLANYWGLNGRRDIADRYLRQAIATDPDDSLVLSFRASLAAADDRLDEAIELQRRSVTAEPLSRVSRHNLAVWLYLDGRFDEARDMLLELQEIDPSAKDPDGLLSRTLVLSRQFEAALSTVEQSSELQHRLPTTALAYIGLGRTEQAEASLREMLELQPMPEPVRLAEVYAYAGQTDLAFKWLNSALEPGPGVRCEARRCWQLRMAMRSPFLAQLHTDPRWRAWTESAQRQVTAPASRRTG